MAQPWSLPSLARSKSSEKISLGLPADAESALGAPTDRWQLIASMTHSTSRRRLWHLCLLLIAIAALPGAPAHAQSTESSTLRRPNIIFILADDLGYGDLGCYSAASQVPTPHLDALAAGGLRFTDAYCPISICTPTRFALMTGVYPWRAKWQGGVARNWEGPLIPAPAPTLPGVLKSAGYHTGGFGKWHLGADFKTTDGRKVVGTGAFKHEDNGANLDLRAPIANGPLDRGFDEWFGFITASEGLIIEGSRPAALLGHDLYKDITAAGAQDLPKISLPDYLPEITRRSLAFLGAQPPGRPFFLYFAPYVPHVPLAVAPSFRGKTRAGDYGDYVHELDDAIGQLVAALKANGQFENTLILFASDNGSEFLSSGADHHPNGPLRGRKHEIFEGGVRTPFLAHWPGRTPAGRACHDLLSLTDIVPTVAALTGQPLPAGKARDGVNQLPAILGGADAPPARTEVVVCDGSGRPALRSGQWKWIPSAKKQEQAGASGSQGPSALGALYDLATDPGETMDVAAGHPDLVQQLSARLQAIRQSDWPGGKAN